MATDAIGQTIPSWVEDNSYELKSVGTFTSNEGLSLIHISEPTRPY